MDLTISEAARQQWVAEMANAEQNNRAWKRFSEAYLACVRNEWRVQHFVLESVRTEEVERRTDAAYWVERAYAEAHTHIAPCVLTVVNSVPHAIQAALVAVKSPRVRRRGKDSK